MLLCRRLFTPGRANSVLTPGPAGLYFTHSLAYFPASLWRFPALSPSFTTSLPFLLRSLELPTPRLSAAPCTPLLPNGLHGVSPGVSFFYFRGALVSYPHRPAFNTSSFCLSRWFCTLSPRPHPSALSLMSAPGPHLQFCARDLPLLFGRARRPPHRRSSQGPPWPRLLPAPQVFASCTPAAASWLFEADFDLLLPIFP